MMEVNDLPVGQIVKEMRERLGISQRQLGKKSGIDQAYISLLEAGKTGNITVAVLARIASGLGVPPSSLVDAMTVGQTDIRAFLTNELASLNEDEIDWLRRSIDMIRDKKNERQRYDASENDEGEQL